LGFKLPACCPVQPTRPRCRLAGKDAVPDDAFRRLRGALFFGPSWRVTRNKLMFRDNLQQALAAAAPADRHLERRVREWLAECHANLDRIIRFESMCGAAAQVGGCGRLRPRPAAALPQGDRRRAPPAISGMGFDGVPHERTPARRPPRGASWGRT
jgi:hypothetical protein